MATKIWEMVNMENKAKEKIIKELVNKEKYLLRYIEHYKNLIKDRLEEIKNFL
jgi:hypothetical protein